MNTKEWYEVHYMDGTVERHDQLPNCYRPWKKYVHIREEMCWPTPKPKHRDGNAYIYETISYWEKPPREFEIVCVGNGLMVAEGYQMRVGERVKVQEIRNA